MLQEVPTSVPSAPRLQLSCVVEETSHQAHRDPNQTHLRSVLLQRRANVCLGCVRWGGCRSQLRAFPGQETLKDSSAVLARGYGVFCCRANDFHFVVQLLKSGPYSRELWEEAYLAFFCPVTLQLICFNSGACSLGKTLVMSSDGKHHLRWEVLLFPCVAVGRVTLSGAAAASKTGLVALLALRVLLSSWISRLI